MYNNCQLLKLIHYAHPDRAALAGVVLTILDQVAALARHGTGWRTIF